MPRLRRLLACLILALPAAAWAQAETILLGVDRFTVGWEPGTGDPMVYAVWVSTNGAPGQIVQIVEEPQATLPAQNLDTYTVGALAIGVGARAIPSLSPTSPASDPIRILPPPAWITEALFALHCASCESLQLRPGLSAPSEVPAHPAPWRVAGIGPLVAEPDLDVVWQSDGTGEIRIVGLGDDLDPPLASAAGMGRVLGLAEIDGDANRELVVQGGDGQSVDFFDVAGAGLSLVGSMPGIRYWSLVDLADFDGDGLSDLWWHRPGRTPGQLEIWKGDASGAVALLMSLDAGPGELADAADFDADGHPDALWRDAAGRLTISRLVPGPNGAPGTSPGSVALLHEPGDEHWEVRGAAEVDHLAGAEVLVQHRDSLRVGLRREPVGNWTGRSPVFDVGRRFELVHAE